MAKKTSRNTGGEPKTVAKKSTTLPTTMNLAADAGQGLENADRDSYAIPFLVILQTNSPQCDEDNDAHVEGAKAGSFFNIATVELFDGKRGVDLIPASFSRRFLEWAPRESGGGFRGDHAPDDVDTMKLQRDEAGRLLLDNGNYLMDTRQHFCIMITEAGPMPVVFSLTSTQIKKSRAWMTRMSMIKMVDKNKKKFTPPTFSHVYRMTTVSESNEKGTWKGVDIAKGRLLKDSESTLYAAAKEFKKQVQSGLARMEQPQGTDADDESDF